MTDQQKEFIYESVVKQTPYNEITKTLGISRSTLTEWDTDPKVKMEKNRIATIRNLWVRKKNGGKYLPEQKVDTPFSDFFEWYEHQDKKCHYCGITEHEIAKLLHHKRLETKRLKTRGKKLELDRKNPESPYDDLENLVFACYWCNNAKTDTFTEEEFLRVGEVFRNIWMERLKNTEP